MAGKCQLEEISPVCPLNGSEWDRRTVRAQLSKYNAFSEARQGRVWGPAIHEIRCILSKHSSTLPWSTATLFTLHTNQHRYGETFSLMNSCFSNAQKMHPQCAMNFPGVEISPASLSEGCSLPHI